MVELIQMTEYLDDMPTWGHRDYRLYPPHYGDPFYRGRGRGRGGRGRREWIQERQMERPSRNSAGPLLIVKEADPIPCGEVGEPPLNVPTKLCAQFDPMMQVPCLLGDINHAMQEGPTQRAHPANKVKLTY